ncbi:MAG: methyltransferase domain-containing protein [Egibacteraceae bacterium]
MRNEEPSGDVDPTRATELLRTLTEELVAKGALRSPQWRVAFERTPRHPFVPRYYRRMPAGRELVDGARPEQHQMWLAAVYTDDALVTQYDERDPRIATSSSTQPTLMALMLEALDLRDGHSVLEIGTGTGYNAALLCARLGSGLVTTIDIDPGLVHEARQRLQQAGHAPTVAVANGAEGYPANAPYDRIIATCAVPCMPCSWIAQTRPGGLILANLRGGFGGGLVRIEVADDGSAVGKLLPDPAAFIAMRGARLPQPPLSELVSLSNGNGVSRSASMPSGLEDESFWLLAGFGLPHAVRFGSLKPEVLPPRLVDLGDGSWSRVDRTPEDGHTVTQGGPRSLWDELESLHDRWLELGKPASEQYGLTVTADGRQYVWVDSPDSEHTWDLPPARPATAG